MISRNDVVRYLIHEYYGGDAGRAAKAAQFSKQQVIGWIEDKNAPQKSKLGWLIHQTFAPEFMVIAEYETIETSGSDKGIHAQLARILKGHEKASGLYAFYNSMANLIYLGKSDGHLLEECYNRLRAALNKHVFPKGAKQPKTRRDVVRYVSAYYVRESEFVDHAKHVEALILRISKPVLNTYIGEIQKAHHPQN